MREVERSDYHAISGVQIAYKASHPGVISAVAGGGECKILLSDFNSERHPDVAVYATPTPTGGDV